MTALRMDVDRAVEIARNKHAATPRERRDAFFWTVNRLTSDRAADLTHIERRRLREVRERLTHTSGDEPVDDEIEHAVREAATHLKTLADTSDGERRAMTRDESDTFVRCSMMEHRGGPKAKIVAARELFADMQGEVPFSVKVMIGRLKAAGEGLVFSEPTVIFLTSLCSTPARLVLWAHWLVARTRALPSGQAVTMSLLADRFPWGFPTDDGYARIWDEQKHANAPGSNLLDTVWAWRPAAESQAAA